MSKGENMLEICARAVHAIQFEDKEQAEYEWHNFSGAQEFSQKLARAVIEALMLPTPEMVSFGIDAMSRDDLEPTEDEFSAGFVAALRTASKPNEEGEGK